jgi:hypothetical protein
VSPSVAWEIQQGFAGTSWDWNSAAVRRPNYCARAYIRRRWLVVSGLIDNRSVAGRSNSKTVEFGR